ncbi:HNH endonuclease [Bacillus paralicheniformis]|nr:HNH endonuclease [Bacillus paralicheniformis]
MPLKRCNAPGCREYVDWTQKYCEKHQGYADKHYNKTVRYNRENNDLYSYYHSREWKLLREQKLRESNYHCAICAAQGRLNKSDRLVVHHKHKELRDVLNDDAARNDLSNLEVLCQYHHNQVTFGKENHSGNDL